jgi:tRNA threonylcarbamoyladenosine dehydratase
MPITRVDTVEEYVTKDNVPSFFAGGKKPSYVIDCIDNIEAKVELLAYCKK